MPPKKSGSRPASAAVSATNSNAANSKNSNQQASGSGSTGTQSTQQAVDQAALAAEQILPNKYQTQFRHILRLYEIKQYKKALKSCEEILKKHPNHGETLAMKGLTLNNLNRSAEAHLFVKKGVNANLKSHVCWHVYGLLYRSEHKYNDAIKCYQVALKYDPENVQILKDLSLLQIQRRMLTGFTETRRKLLLNKQNNRNNWIAFACGYHLQKNFSTAINVIDAFLKANINNEKDKTPNFEDSELMLYRGLILLESGDYSGSLSYLDSVSSQIVDKLYLRETRASLLLKLNRSKEAQEEYRALLDINDDNYDYHKGLWKSMGLLPLDDSTQTFNEDQIKSLSEIYQDLKGRYPRSAAVNRLPLDFLQGSSFKESVDKYLQNGLRKGLPSLFADLRPLYNRPEKVQIIQEIVQSYITNLNSHSTFTSASDGKKESPVALLWTYYFFSQHYDFLNNPKLALSYCDSAISHTPTLVDLYVLRARIYKHSGDFATAHYWMDAARCLDTADRYLNTKAVRYAWRANLPLVAESTVTLFLRDHDQAKAASTLAEMQVQWYEIQAGLCFYREKQFGRALKQFLSIDKHFFDFAEDQFDFHTYCLRKVTLRAYTDMLRWEDKLKQHKFYFLAALHLVKIYLELHDRMVNPPVVESTEDSNLTDEEKKAIEKKKRREAAKAKRLAEEEKAKELAEKAAAEKNKSSNQTKDDKDDDPEGENLASIKDPLDQAAKYAKLLLFFCPTKIESHLYAGQVFILQNKLTLALKALKAAKNLQPNHPQLHHFTVSFLLKLNSSRASYNPLILSVIDEEVVGLLNITNPVTLNEKFIKENSKSLVHLNVAAKVSTDPLLNQNKLEGAQQALRLLASIDETIINNSAWRDIVVSLDLLKDLSKFKEIEAESNNQIARIRSLSLVRYPLTLEFGAEKAPRAPGDEQENEINTQE